MNENAKMTSLDMFDVHRKAERIMSHYQCLQEMMTQVCQASTGDGDQDELKHLIETVGHKHAECGTDLKAVLRLVK